jgi:hypothetical protein
MDDSQLLAGIANAIWPNDVFAREVSPCHLARKRLISACFAGDSRVTGVTLCHPIVALVAGGSPYRMTNPATGDSGAR